MFDVIIAGGSYAGLSAALQLARARRRVAVIDAGVRRNRFAHASHGFLGQDGRDPAAIAADAKAQLLAYPNVSWISGTAERGRAENNAFAIDIASGETLSAHRLILATGVRDELPEIEGLKERWGKSVFHCPYCHGYELGGRPVGVLAVSEASMHHGLMLPDWGPTTFFLNGAFETDNDQRAALGRRGVTIEATPVARVGGNLDIELADGRRVNVAGLFVAPRTHMASPLAEQLGCAFEDGPMGPFIRTDAIKETSVPGIFACGDAARAAGSVALAVGDGVMAAMGAHRSLMAMAA